MVGLGYSTYKVEVLHEESYNGKKNFDFVTDILDHHRQIHDLYEVERMVRPCICTLKVITKYLQTFRLHRYFWLRTAYRNYDPIGTLYELQSTCSDM